MHQFSNPAKRTPLRELAGRIESIEGLQPSVRGRSAGLKTGWPGRYAQLSTGGIHEWFGEWFGPGDSESSRRNSPPHLLLMVHLARCALQERPDAAQRVLWIGSRVHPSAASLIAAGEQPRLVLERSLFVDAEDAAARVWAIDLALRCAAVAAVIADGSGLTMPHTRRLQLAAQSNGRRGIGLLARPAHDLTVHSCAATRWTVAPAPSSTDRPRWTVVCIRCKGAQRRTALDAASEHLLLESDRVSGRLHLAADAVHRPDHATRQQRVRRTG